MASSTSIVLSASRRTDIPAFYMDWFMERIHRQSFQTVNPYNRVSRVVSARVEDVHTIVFWSKNFKPFLDMGAGRRLRQLGYNLVFQYTVNSPSALLEPGIPPLENRLEQLRRLCREFGPETVTWRFDPVCFYETPEGPGNNLSDFAQIARAAAAEGIGRCVTSFADNYRKIQYRLKRLAAKGKPLLTLVDPAPAKKAAVLVRMEKVLSGLGIRLFTCCESGVTDLLPEQSTVRAGACISGRAFKKLFGGSPVLARDHGQRSKQGCQCTLSVDVGSYDLHPCLHDCLFCYANPSLDAVLAKEISDR